MLLNDQTASETPSPNTFLTPDTFFTFLRATASRISVTFQTRQARPPHAVIRQVFEGVKVSIQVLFSPIYFCQSSSVRRVQRYEYLGLITWVFC